MKFQGHAIADLLKTLGETPGRVNCTGLSGAERAYLLVRLYKALKRPIFVLCPGAKEAEALEEDLRFFSDEAHVPIVSFPSYDILPFKPLSYRPETSSRRVEALYRMMTVSRPSVIITTVFGLLQKVIPKEALSRCCEYVLPGEETDRDEFIRTLIQDGYQEAALVEEPGDFAVRGALIDVFPPLYRDPVRIEFFGDAVDSVRSFSVQDQLSRGSFSESDRASGPRDGP